MTPADTPFDERYDILIFPPDPGERTGPPFTVLADDEDPGVAAAFESLARMSEQAPAPRALVTYGPVAADAARRAIVDASVARAAACGLTLPVLVVRFIEAGRDVHDGQAMPLDAEPLAVRVTLRTGVALDRLHVLVLHELMHAADMRAGLFSNGMTTYEAEMRALAFQQNASLGWQPAG